MDPLDYMLRGEDWPIDRHRCAKKLHMGLSTLQSLYRSTGHYSKPGRKVVFTPAQFLSLLEVSRAPRHPTRRTQRQPITLDEDMLAKVLRRLPEHKPR